MDDDYHENEWQWMLQHADAELTAVADMQFDPLRLQRRLQSRHAPSRRRMLMELADLRQRARAKFALADRMFFTKRGLEQSSGEILADYKASRFPMAAPVFDLCTGIGGDAMALGRRIESARGELTICDLDPTMIEIARANLRVHGIAVVRAETKDALRMELPATACWHLDPDRRTDGRRHSDPANYQPSLGEALQRFGDRAGCIKIAPAADVGSWIGPAVEREWLAFDRECSQQLVWTGDLAAHPNRRTATLVWTRNDQQLGWRTMVQSQPDVRAAIAADCRGFIHEPAPCVLAAGLDQELAALRGMERLGAGAAYYTSDVDQADESLLRSFAVLDDLPLRTKWINASIRRHGGRVVDVKKRGVAVDPKRLRSQLQSVSKTQGDRKLVLIAYPRGDAVRVAVTEPLSPRLD